MTREDQWQRSVVLTVRRGTPERQLSAPWRVGDKYVLRHMREIHIKVLDNVNVLINVSSELAVHEVRHN